MYDIKMLKAKKIAELIEIADQKGLKNLKGQKKQDIIDAIIGNSEDKKSVEVKSESEKNPVEVKSESEKNKRPYRVDRNPRNHGNKNHHNLSLIHI